MIPVVDILLATYNGAAYLDQQIESIIAQSCLDWRIIARDDGSQDQTISILQKYHDLLGARFILLPNAQKKLGAAQNFSELISHSSSPYIMFCDQDDVWLPGKLMDTLSIMQVSENQWGKNMPILVHSDLIVTDSSLNILHNSFWKFQNINPQSDGLNRLLAQNTVTGCSMMINRATLFYGKNIPKEAIMHDWWLALICSAFGKIVTMPQSTLYYRQHHSNDTGAKKWSIEFILNKIDVNAAKSRLYAKIKQASAFLENYRCYMSTEQVSMLEKFTQLNSENWFMKRYFLIKYRILMQGIVRNLGFLTFI